MHKALAALLSRLGSLALSPRRLARRDLAARDGKAGDDLILFAVLALLLDGTTALLRAARAFAAGRSNSGLQRLLEVASPAGPLLLLWLVLSALFALFTLRAPRRAPGELGARVALGFILTSIAVSPVAASLDPGPLRYTLESLPWAASAILFGLMLRESLDPPSENESVPLPIPAQRIGLLVVLVCATSTMLHLRGAWDAAPSDAPIVARGGALAPSIDLPLLHGGRFQLAAQRGRPVFITFWATWCGPCLDELPALERSYAALRAQGADPIVYAINVDDEGPERSSQVNGVVARLGLHFPIALDDGQVGAAYSIASIPTAVRIDAEGRLREVIDRPLDEAGLRDALRP